jgi:RHS repeat-associated protein
VSTASRGSLATDFQYTGQRSFETAQGASPSLGSLVHYKARSYSPILGQFLQPDTIVPSPGNPRDLNRYTYTRTNPLKYVDASGHATDCVTCSPVLPRPPEPPRPTLDQLQTALQPTGHDNSDDGVPSLCSGDLRSLCPAGQMQTNTGGIRILQQEDLIGAGAANGLAGAADGGGGGGSGGKGSRKGGRYKDIAANGGEVHHTPAKSISWLSEGDGPSIWMEKLDHQETASWGPGPSRDAYREAQHLLVEQGLWEDAITMDIQDIRGKFGKKYDEGLLQMVESLDGMGVNKDRLRALIK